jgi:hypothetical protein
LAVLLSSLTACTNSPSAKNLEQSLAADPRLQRNSTVFGENQSGTAQPTPNASTVSLPTDFPKQIPIYPNAKLEEVKPATASGQKVSTRWQSSDPSNVIASFYRNQFQTNNWQISQQPSDDVGGSFTAQQNDLLVTITIQPKSVTNAAPNQPQTLTELTIDYTPQTTASSQPDGKIDSGKTPQPGEPNYIGPTLPSTNVAKQPANHSDGHNTFAVTSVAQEFNDLNKVPPEWRQHIQDLATLGVLSLDTTATKNNSTVAANQFDPSKIITRREYARWLVSANNMMYANNPAKQIRLAGEGTQPAFKDVSPQDSDFPAIQGLAEAGLIPSPLSGDATAVLFRPDAPLTREQLLSWKVPLDTRQALPAANLETVKQTWGFQDAEKVDPKAIKAILADYQNAEKSNIRRVFGYTTLFQPKKPVTRAEAAETLWYFGTQGEGISATEALKLKS